MNADREGPQRDTGLPVGSGTFMSRAEQTTFSLSMAPPPPERRRQPRHISILRVGSIFLNDRRELCLIRNISAGGLMAHIYSVVSDGQAVAVELKSNQRISGTISWIEGSNVGIRFDEPVDVEDLLASQGTMDNGWRPRLPRVEVDRLATVRVGSRVYGVSTRDISQGGVKVETDAPFDEGAEVVLTFDKFRPIHGVVRWYSDGLCGIAFNQVIPFQELMNWLRSR
jgi:hypothetical protein